MADPLDRVIHYGAFKEAFDRVVDIMRSELGSSIIIRGNPGTGKTTLLKEALKKTGVRSVVLTSHCYPEDLSAMKAIVNQLGFDTRALHVSDLMDQIRNIATGDEKLVLILIDFEEFERKRQSLLYNLMNLIHTNLDPNQTGKGSNITLIGLTHSLDWAENVEKRVRSRLNAKCIDLSLPYRNQDEFFEFTSRLLDGYQIDGEFKEHLEYIYQLCPRSIRTLKKWLNNFCTIDGKGKLKIDFDPTRWPEDYQMLDNNLFRERLRYLTRPQLDLMKLAVYYCYREKVLSFTLTKLQDKIYREDKHKILDVSSNHALRDANLLAKLKLFKTKKSEEVISDETIFHPATTAIQFKAVIEGDVDLHNSPTDFLWRCLKGR